MATTSKPFTYEWGFTPDSYQQGKITDEVFATAQTQATHCSRSNIDGSPGPWVPFSAAVAMTAILDNTAKIGQRVVIGDGAQIGYKAMIGHDVTIGAGAMVGSFCEIADGAIIFAGAIIANNAKIAA